MMGWGPWPLVPPARARSSSVWRAQALPRASEGPCGSRDTRGSGDAGWGRGRGRLLAQSQGLGCSRLLRQAVLLQQALHSRFGGLEMQLSPFACVQGLHNLHLSTPWPLIAVRYLTETFCASHFSMGSDVRTASKLFFLRKKKKAVYFLVFVFWCRGGGCLLLPSH